MENPQSLMKLEQRGHGLFLGWDTIHIQSHIQTTYLLVWIVTLMKSLYKRYTSTEEKFLI